MKRVDFKELLAAVVLAVIVTLVVFAITVSSYSFVLDRTGKDQVYFMGYKPVTVVTGSMEPAIRVNSISVAKKVKISDIDLNDIVMYRTSNNVLVTHRVIAINNENGEISLTTKGDNNNSEDIYPIKSNNLEAKIVYTNNTVAPIISEVLPQNGIPNTLAVIRTLIIIALSAAASVMVCSAIIRALKQTYWMTSHTKEFERTVNNHEKLNKILKESYANILDSKSHSGIKLSLLSSIRVGLHRAKMKKDIHSLIKDAEDLLEASIKYRKVYYHEMERNLRIKEERVKALKDRKQKLERLVQKEEEVYTTIETIAYSNIHDKHLETGTKQKKKSWVGGIFKSRKKIKGNSEESTAMAVEIKEEH